MTIPESPIPESPGRRRSRWENIANPFWGYDYFISYQWETGGKYALALAKCLQDRGYDCFLDRTEYAMSDDWIEEGKLALRRTQRLVLIATSQAVMNSKPVAREVEIFTARSNRILPIVFGGYFSDAEREVSPVLKQIPESILYINELPENLTNGPSTNVIDQLIRTDNVLRRRAFRARIITAVILVLILAAIVSTLFGLMAGSQRNSARKSLRSSLFNQAKLEGQSQIPGRKWRALNVIREAAAINSESDLRDELLHILELGDAKQDHVASLPPEFWRPKFDPGKPQFATPSGGSGACFFYDEELERLVAIPRDGYPMVWQPQVEGGPARIPNIGELTLPGAISLNGRYLAAKARRANTTEIWEIGKDPVRIGVIDGMPSCMVFDPLSQTLAIVLDQESTQAKVALYSVARRTLDELSPLGNVQVDCLAFDRTGSILAAHVDKQIVLWGLKSGTASLELETSTRPGMMRTYPPVPRPKRIHFSNDNRLLCAVGDDGVLKVWSSTPLVRPADARVEGILERTELWSNAVYPLGGEVAQFSPDGKCIASIGIGEGSRFLDLWEAETGRRLLRISGEPLSDFGSSDFQWHVKTQQFACCGLHEDMVEIWNYLPPISKAFRISTRQNTASPTESSVRFSPEEKWLLCGSHIEDNRLPVVDLRQKQLGLMNVDVEEATEFNTVRALANVDRDLAEMFLDVVSQNPSRPRNSRLQSIAKTKDGRLAAGIQEGISVQSISLVTGESNWEFDAPRAPRPEGVPRSIPSIADLTFDFDGSQLLAKIDTSSGRNIVLFDNKGANVGTWKVETGQAFFQNRQPMILAEEIQLDSDARFQKPFSFRLWRVDEIEKVRRETTNDQRTPGAAKQIFVARRGEICLTTRYSSRQIDVFDLRRQVHRGDLARPEEQLNINDPPRQVSYFQDTVVINQDASRCAAYYDHNHIGVWDLTTCSLVAKCELDAQAFTFGEKSGDREDVVCIIGNGRVFVWNPDTDTKSETNSLQDAVGSLMDLRFSPSANRVSGTLIHDRVYKMSAWELPTGKKILSRRPMAGAISQVISPDGLQNASIVEGDIPTIWDLPTKQPAWTAESVSPGHSTLALTEDSRFLGLFQLKFNSDQLEVYDRATMKRQFQTTWQRKPGDPVRNRNFRFSRDGTLIAVASVDQVEVFEVSSGRKLPTLAHIGVEDLSWGANANTIASVSTEGNAILWNLRGGTGIKFPTDVASNRIALSDSGRWLTTGDNRGVVRIWNLNDVRQELKECGLKLE